jgi:uncharacterized protein YbjT (DUF2867 family)
MNIILGATGHIGSSLAKNLLEEGEPVTVIVRSEEKGKQWEEQGAEVTIADILDTDSLQKAFNKGEKLFLLNPPAPPNTDTVKEEQKTLTAILNALRKAKNIKKVVAESTYGAQPGQGIGDLGVLYDMEQNLKHIGIPHSIIRAAYYMTNWDMSLDSAHKAGVIHTLYPTDFKLPMVAPDDIAKVAARLMMEPIETTGLHYVEGPETYSTDDVAAAFTKALGKPIKAETTPKDQWQKALQSMGFSEKAAASMAKMTDITLQDHNKKGRPEKGTITLEAYITRLVQKAQRQAHAPSTL